MIIQIQNIKINQIFRVYILITIKKIKLKALKPFIQTIINYRIKTQSKIPKKTVVSKKEVYHKLKMIVLYKYQN